MSIIKKAMSEYCANNPHSEEDYPDRRSANDTNAAIPVSSDHSLSDMYLNTNLAIWNLLKTASINWGNTSSSIREIVKDNWKHSLSARRDLGSAMIPIREKFSFFFKKMGNGFSAENMNEKELLLHKKNI